jgi:tRNA A37 threonylcarbamoyltransferase TsaD
MYDKNFLAFHISGGTSQALLVEPIGDYFKTTMLSDSLDLKAGQAVDRVGLMLGLNFPCGPELEKLALKSSAQYKKIKVFSKKNLNVVVKTQGGIKKVNSLFSNCSFSFKIDDS